MENDILHIKIKPDGLNLQPCGNGHEAPKPVKTISSRNKKLSTKLLIKWSSDYMATHIVNNNWKYI